MSLEQNKKFGIYKKYEVTKISNPEKKIDCIVMEFDDPIARVAIEVWADEMAQKGYLAVAKDVYRKLWGIS